MTDKNRLSSSIENHYRDATEKVKRIFNLLNPEILRLSNAINYARKNYIGYKLIEKKSPFVEMHFKKRIEKIQVHLRPIDHSSSKLKINVKPESHLWKLNTVVDICNENEIAPALELIKKSYDHVLRY